MFDVKTIKPFKEFKYWFTPVHPYIFTITADDLDMPLIYNHAQHAIIPRNGMESYIAEHQDEIKSEFDQYLTRPEAMVGMYIDKASLSKEQVADTYDRLIYGVSLIRAKQNGTKDPDVAIPKITKILSWLHSTDFYTAPASTKWHEVFECGLVIHTLNVVNQVLELTELTKFSTVRLESAVLCALVHDWGKIDCYRPYNKNVKNEETGEWNSVPAYTKIDSKFPFGHCTSSMVLAQQAFVLSLDELLAIRWHHGDWDVSQKEVSDLQVANAEVPLVFMLQFADRLAITRY